MKKYFAELIGTFALVFCGTGAIVVDQETSGAVSHIGIAFTFGLIVMVMIYALGPISGAHLNPAVTIAFWVAKRFPPGQILPYIFSQIVGALLASGILRLLFANNPYLGSTLPRGPAFQSFVLETILTFFLMLVIIHVATGSKEQGMFAGLAIGSTVLLEAMFAGPICGASMNPARSLSPAVVSGHFEHLWIYLTAPVAGSVLAILVWKILKTKDDPNEQI
ncbi:MAG TPA: MIP family channel protein [Chryseosolibacter sp.]|nr:MIP family channel protein [Chryseosolibacter sp.]